MSGSFKKTTGLTGLAVNKDAKKSLIILYTKLMNVLSGMPETAVYRQKTQVIIQDRLNAVNEEKTLEKMEKRIQGGQAEELILQAERELNLARKMVEWKPWEGTAKEAPPNQWKWPI